MCYPKFPSWMKHCTCRFIQTLVAYIFFRCYHETIIHSLTVRASCVVEQNNGRRRWRGQDRASVLSTLFTSAQQHKITHSFTWPKAVGCTQCCAVPHFMEVQGESWTVPMKLNIRWELVAIQKPHMPILSVKQTKQCDILQTSSGNAGHVQPVPKVYGPQDFKKMDISTAWHVAGYSSFQSALQYMQTVLYGFTRYGHKLLGELFSPISGSANFWCQVYYHGHMKRQQVRVNTIFFSSHFPHFLWWQHDFSLYTKFRSLHQLQWPNK